MGELPAFVLGAVMGSLCWAVAAWQLSHRKAKKSRQKEESLLRRTQRSERLAELGKMTGHLAHEIRNPLSIIKVNLKLLSEDMARHKIELGKYGANKKDTPGGPAWHLERQHRKIETISNETDRLANTLSDFLAYTGRMELRPANHNLNELLDDLTDFYEPQAIQQGIQMRRSLNATSAICRIDADLIKQAFLNLFINATQAMPGGGELIIRSTTRAETLQVDVIDTGPGVAADQQEKIFEAYYTTRTGGTGLGLPMCRRIIEEHNGQIQLHSEPGKGSNFMITLPLVT
ncbi:MAG: two-component sensor histidine kinase [Planctomycetes bacterium]|nr:two-component sensor histidine kinase [Planctomycetota bacterium]